MARGCWPCHGSGSCGFGSCGGGSSNSQFYKLADEVNDLSSDDHAPATPLGDDVNLAAQPDEETTEMPARRWQP